MNARLEDHGIFATTGFWLRCMEISGLLFELLLPFLDKRINTKQKKGKRKPFSFFSSLCDGSIMMKKQPAYMKWFKIIGIIFIILGFSSFIGANYIRSQVDQGKKRVKKAQSNLNAVNSAASSNSTLYFFSKAATGPIQSQINEGKKDIVYFQSLAQNLDISGWVLVVIGAGVTIWAFYRGKRG